MMPPAYSTLNWNFGVGRDTWLSQTQEGPAGSAMDFSVVGDKAAGPFSCGY